jgi:hypothetical protein
MGTLYPIAGLRVESLLPLRWERRQVVVGRDVPHESALEPTSHITSHIMDGVGARSVLAPRLYVTNDFRDWANDQIMSKSP